MPTLIAGIHGALWVVQAITYAWGKRHSRRLPILIRYSALWSGHKHPLDSRCGRYHRQPGICQHERVTIENNAVIGASSAIIRHLSEQEPGV
jgi:hypothetical protein